MDTLINRLQHPVKRHRAETYLLITLLSFAGSVTFTRLFLYLTGYPQVGSGGLHIAHVLWGGLLLFIASLLPILWANRWVYSLGSVLAGVGVGLFIDEVGKFITQSNDYFYPPAATIIYAFFLLTVLLYLRIRRHTKRDPRIELYIVLDMLEDVLDHDLDPNERQDVEERLRYVAGMRDNSNLSRLAQELLEFVTAEGLSLAPPPSRWITRLQSWISDIERRYLNQGRFRAILAGGCMALGMVALAKLGQLMLYSVMPGPLNATLEQLLKGGQIKNLSSITLFLVRVYLEGTVGLMLLIGGVVLALKRDKVGINLLVVALLLSLTTVDLLIFYFDQFSTITFAFFQFITLIGALYYRRRYLQNPQEQPKIKSPQLREEI
jgi:hypothetical protein